MESINDAVTFFGSGRTGVVLDYDGVSAALVERHDEAIVVPSMQAGITGLMARSYTALLTGRPASYVSTYMPNGLDVFGLNGIERGVVGQGRTAILPEFMDRIAVLRTFVEQNLPMQDLQRLGVAIEASDARWIFHWRPVVEASRPEAIALIRDILGRANAAGLDVIDYGEMWLGIAVPEMWSKAQGIDRVIREAFGPRGIGQAVIFGDSNGDMHMVRAAEAILGGRDKVYCVAVRQDHTGADLLHRADLVLEGTQECEAFLNGVSAQLLALQQTGGQSLV